MQKPLKKSSGFKCPTFAVPAKSGVQQKLSLSKTEEKVEKALSNPGPCGDVNSNNGSAESAKITGLGDNKSNAENVPSTSETVPETNTDKTSEGEKTTTESGSVPKIDKVKEKKKFESKKKPEKAPKDEKVNVKKNTGSKQKTSESEKAPKPEKVKKPKVEKEKETLPVRSLTDEEYDAIFDAVLENAMSMNIDDFVAKVTSPVKVKEPVKKKYSITVGKKTKQETPPKPAKQSDSCLSEDQSKPDSSLTAVNKSDDDKLNAEDKKEYVVNFGLDEMDDNDPRADAKDKNNSSRNEPDTENKENISENNTDGEGGSEADKVEDDNIADEEADVAVPDVHNNDNVPNEQEDDVEMESGSAFQEENEVTPTVSVADEHEKLPLKVVTPVKKKKKILKSKNKLEPKHLPFDDNKDTSMVDTIRKMKELKKSIKADKKNKMKVKLSPDVVQAKKEEKPKKKMSKKRHMQERTLDIQGTWVMCCNSDCNKWRYLNDISDPSQVPDRWTCSMNTKTEYNSCDKPEENYDESEHIYTKFTEGSVVWAKMSGYPWWPAMVEIDPDTESFFSIDSDDEMFPTHYHVVFLDEHVSRTWVKAENVIQFTGDEEADGVTKQFGKRKGAGKTDTAKAKKNALNALKCTLKERIELFGFAARYKGPWMSSTAKATKAKKRKTDTRVHQEKVDNPEYLDDETVDDVLENTESLLDNVEEMLNSLDSQISDIDDDIEFMPQPKKRRSIDKKSTTIYSSDDNCDDKSTKDEEISIDIIIENIDVKNLDEGNLKVETQIDDNKKQEATIKEEAATANKIQIENKPVNKTKKEKEKEITPVKIKKGKKITSVSKGRKDKKMEISNSPKECKEEVTESAEKNDEQNVKETNNETDSKSEELDIVGDEENCIKQDNDKENYNDGVKKFDSEKIDDCDVFDVLAEEGNCLKPEHGNANKHDDDNFDDADDEFDLNDDVDNEDDNKPEAVVDERHGEQSLAEEDCNDFDLEEHYMYETTTDDATSKIRERAAVVVPATEVDEDSDPFDLMEE